jgi:hypothetical protein
MRNSATDKLMLEADLLHLMSVAIGAVYLSVEDAAARLGVVVRKVSGSGLGLQSSYHSGEWFEQYRARVPKWALSEPDLQRIFAQTTKARHLDVSDGARAFRVDVWNADGMQVTAPAS